MLSEKPWRAELVVLLCAAIFICLVLGALTIGGLQQLGVRGFQEPEDIGCILIGTLSFQGFAWLFILVFLRRHHVNWRDAFGLRGPDLKRALGLALLTIVIVLPVVWKMQAICIQMLTDAGKEPPAQEVVSLLTNSHSIWSKVYLAVFAVVMVPVAEEFIFRGMLYPFVKQLGFPRLAWFSVSVLFALIHVNLATLFPLFVLALALTWLYEHTDNLLAPITAHALFNVANLAVWYYQHRGELGPLPK